ncbi:MAG: glutaminyl-peptide cyclotransferase [Bacteroidales bacterium]|nr:glutaminyl-peptide cyclotransferase [Bacteroidales bacterium]
MKCLLVALMCLFVSSCAEAQVKRYELEVVGEYQHDVQAYTQGLFFHADTLYESTGLNGKSSLRKVELSSGKVLDSKKIGKKYFAEGSCVLGDKLYVLTWQNQVVFVYDASSLEYQMSYSFAREGWGLTTDGKQLIASDGSSRLTFYNSDLQQVRSITVTMNGRPVRLLNELEWVDGRIWANVYTSDIIVVINPSTGRVEATIDCTGLLPDKLRTRDTDVLNGIAVDSSGRIFLTGKNWPRLYEVKLIEQK